MSTEHYDHLQQLLARLIEDGFVVNVAKCKFRKHMLEFLRHRIDKHRASPLPSKVQAVTEFPALNTVKGLQAFFVMVMYHHCFLPHVAGTLQPLFPAIATKSKHIQWTDLMRQSILDMKMVLTQAVTLSHPQADAPNRLSVDASDIAVGAGCPKSMEANRFLQQAPPSTRKEIQCL